MAFPGSSHTRFEHCLGAMYLAGETASYLLLNRVQGLSGSTQPIISYFNDENQGAEVRRLVQIARLGALLHDIGHGPLSHTFETFLKYCNVKDWEHEHLSLEIIYKCLRDKFSRAENVLATDVMCLLCDIKRTDGKIKINDETSLPALRRIGVSEPEIASMESFLEANWFLNYIIKEDPYNVDRFNYLVLDSGRAGAEEYGSIDYHRIIQNLYIDKDAIIPSIRAKDSAVRFFEAYTHMYRSVYQHKISFGADIHLAVAMSLAAEEEMDNIFKHLKGHHEMSDLLPLTDDVLVYFLDQFKDKVKNPLCKRLIEDYMGRKIITMVHEAEAKPKSKFWNLLDAYGGPPGITNELRKRSGISEDAFLTVISLEEKRVAPQEFSGDILGRITFLDKRGKRQDSDSEIIQSLSSKKLYRVYTTKDDDIKGKVEKAISELLK